VTGEGVVRCGLCGLVWSGTVWEAHGVVWEVGGVVWRGGRRPMHLIERPAVRVALHTHTHPAAHRRLGQPDHGVTGRVVELAMLRKVRTHRMDGVACTDTEGRRSTR
jgi:hypothetical protein